MIICSDTFVISLSRLPPFWSHSFLQILIDLTNSSFVLFVLSLSSGSVQEGCSHYFHAEEGTQAIDSGQEELIIHHPQHTTLLSKSHFKLIGTCFRVFIPRTHVCIIKHSLVIKIALADLTCTNHCLVRLLHFLSLLHLLLRFHSGDHDWSVVTIVSFSFKSNQFFLRFPGWTCSINANVGWFLTDLCQIVVSFICVEVVRFCVCVNVCVHLCGFGVCSL